MSPLTLFSPSSSSSRPPRTTRPLYPFPSTNAAYSASLASALSHFQSLLSNPHSKSWKPVSPVPSASGSGSAGSANAGANGAGPGLNGRTSEAGLSTTTSPGGAAGAKGKARATPASTSVASSLVNGLAALDPSQVRVHKKADRQRNAEIVRAIAEVPCDPDAVDLEAVRAVLATPEVRAHCELLSRSYAVPSPTGEGLAYLRSAAYSLLVAQGTNWSTRRIRFPSSIL